MRLRGSGAAPPMPLDLMDILYSTSHGTRFSVVYS